MNGVTRLVRLPSLHLWRYIVLTYLWVPLGRTPGQVTLGWWQGKDLQPAPWRSQQGTGWPGHRLSPGRRCCHYSFDSLWFRTFAHFWQQCEEHIDLQTPLWLLKEKSQSPIHFFSSHISSPQGSVLFCFILFSRKELLLQGAFEMINPLSFTLKWSITGKYLKGR